MHTSELSRALNVYLRNTFFIRLFLCCFLRRAIEYLCAFNRIQMSDKRVRVRFAPSPTGPLHMGGVRTALYNYLFAKKNGGDFLIRVEDTDQTRYVPGAEDYIIEALQWCGLNADEGPHNGGPCAPYRQSERKPMYKPYAEQLIHSGHAYYAFDTTDDLELIREQAKAAGMPNWQYNNVTRNSMKNSLTLSSDEVNERLERAEAYVIRIKMPRNEEIRLHDEIRGWVAVNTNNLDDKVLFKSDGMPTYHMANVVDDHLMSITHVIRGEEWLPSAPLHVFLYRALGWEDTMPKFAHLPLILKPDGNGKLSKRDGDRLGFPVFPLLWTDPETGNISNGYKEEGYLPDAFINMLLMLGWNPGTPQELFSRQEMIDQFSLERVGKSGSKFDPDKAKWFNQQYLRAKSGAELVELVKPSMAKHGFSISDEKLARICTLMVERASFIKDILVEGVYFFVAPQSYNEESIAKKWKPDSAAHMKAIRDIFALETEFNEHKLEANFKAYLESNSIPFGALGPVMRIVLTGGMTGPSVFALAEIIGKEETISRIESAIAKLG